jgi:hypothetical protein
MVLLNNLCKLSRFQVLHLNSDVLGSCGHAGPVTRRSEAVGAATAIQSNVVWKVSIRRLVYGNYSRSQVAVFIFQCGQFLCRTLRIKSFNGVHLLLLGFSLSVEGVYAHGNFGLMPV